MDAPNRPISGCWYCRLWVYPTSEEWISEVVITSRQLVSDNPPYIRFINMWEVVCMKHHVTIPVHKLMSSD